MTRERIALFSTKGSGSNEEERMIALLGPIHPEIFPFDRHNKWRSFKNIMRCLKNKRPRLVCMEGTGIGGGIAVLFGRLFFSVPYVVSSGDAVAPYIASKYPGLGWIFYIYERVLNRFSAGFIGWTPYLVGRALSYGAPRGMTAPGWSMMAFSGEVEKNDLRGRVRQKLGISQEDWVIGIVGSLAWNPRVGYCYGYELVQALLSLPVGVVHALILGDGSGYGNLRNLAGDRIGKDIHMPGNVDRSLVKEYLAAMDLASLPQSVDGVGSFRYSTKLSEYLEAGLPVVTGEIPLSYDLPGNWFWRLPGKAPWEGRYIEALSKLLLHLSLKELESKRKEIPRCRETFHFASQQERTCEFVRDILNMRN